ncbi:hypothetical protein [Paraliomyxa miuraensis]|uniref:hypothetical protein n=1 Tax=Paraliomyxa miuraensis TaxID=376150 RepID=UPI002258CAE8|nr:hypothetical protein [Paraliomyxa miuraensis]MCX4239487.1 hypothetical protein [Paraliomyxa miuraensis]
MAMTCFEVVKQVLDATYADIPGDEATRDAAIKSALASMTKDYKDLTHTGGPDFSDPVVRFAYVFKYVSSHSHWLYELIGWNGSTKELFRQKKLRMVAIGGGPGSDLVGVLKYMDTMSASPSLHCELIDGCLGWKTTWSDLAHELDWSRPLHTDYVTHDVGDPGTWDAPSNIAKADLVTLSFFVSEIYHLGTAAEDYLRTMLKRLKPGAIVLFSDNNAPKFYTMFDRIAAEAGLEVLESDQGNRKIYDWGEQKDAIGVYAKKFEHQARLSGSLSWRVLRKPTAS